MQLITTRPELKQPNIEQFSVNGRRYSVIVEGDGPLVVCLHGFPDNFHTFRWQIPALVDAGYRVACPMLPGYESDSALPGNHYDMETVSHELTRLISVLRKSLCTSKQNHVHLVGHDWGAISGLAAITKRPDLFASFTSITIPYNLSLFGILRHAPSYLPYSWYIQYFQVPFLPERTVPLRNWAFIEMLIKRWSPGWAMPQDNLDSIKETLHQPNVLKSALAYYRALYGISDREQRARRLLNQRIKVPTLFLRGESDGCIHSSLWNVLDDKTFVPPYEIQSISGGHFLHQENPEATNHYLLTWLQRHTCRTLQTNTTPAFTLNTDSLVNR
ncbi:MAG: alpha/beta hydrolase [Pseudomonadales bacterium]|nr:alpha/beta hydrolase [Pseudomonadales bacterium]